MPYASMTQVVTAAAIPINHTIMTDWVVEYTDREPSILMIFLYELLTWGYYLLVDENYLTALHTRLSAIYAEVLLAQPLYFILLRNLKNRIRRSLTRLTFPTSLSSLPSSIHSFQVLLRASTATSNAPLKDSHKIAPLFFPKKSAEKSLCIPNFPDFSSGQKRAPVM